MCVGDSPFGADHTRHDEVEHAEPKLSMGDIDKQVKELFAEEKALEEESNEEVTDETATGGDKVAEPIASEETKVD